MTHDMSSVPPITVSVESVHDVSIAALNIVQVLGHGSVGIFGHSGGIVHGNGGNLFLQLSSSVLEPYLNLATAQGEVTWEIGRVRMTTVILRE